MSYYEDVYSKPEAHGLELVGTVEWDDEGYKFDLTVVWRDKENGTLYWGDDSGCSCPSPFEEVNSRDGLSTGKFWDLSVHLGQRLSRLLEHECTAKHAPHAQEQIVNLLWKVRSWN